ncbi:MAG: hypothetical protein Q9225_006913 [Loekoesia sp. 1 TL-2023]
MAVSLKHAEHDYIVARQERYMDTYRKGDAKKMMEWMDPDEFVYSDITGNQTGLKHGKVHSAFQQTFADYHDLEVKTLSLHGHKNFTAWEWLITYKPAKDQHGARLAKEHTPPKKAVGCTLMWWKNDKIVKNHDYYQPRDPEA